MKNNYTYLRDLDFLKKIDEQKVKEQLVKITVLDWHENPIKEIQGEVISGSLNLTGSSNIRRTCSLTMVSKSSEISFKDVNYYISLNKKISLEIGFINTTGEYFQNDIIWFPLGKFVIINPSISHSSGGTTISLQLKDKMCLLNGECGGVIPASVVLSEIEDVDKDGNMVVTRPTIYQIIQEAVNHFGGEDLNKIIISDLDTRIKKVMKWTGSTPLYIIKTTENGTTQYEATTDEAAAAGQKNVQTYESGRDIGYVYSDFTYPGDLVVDGGQSVCNILDSIKTVLGNYEYFYDIDGNFVFQEIKNFLNTTQAKVELDKLEQDNYLIDIAKGKSVYHFDDSKIITSYSNTPQYGMIKNDFVVWGVRESVDGIEMPIRYHLAIDYKPKVGNTYDVFFYKDEDGIEKAKLPIMFDSKDDFPDPGAEEVFYMDTSTGLIYLWDAEELEYVSVTIGLESITTTDWRTELYLQGVMAEPFGSDSNYYYTELVNEWPKLYDIRAGKFREGIEKNPYEMDFFLDFIDSHAAIGEFSVENIGRRSKVINDDSVNCLFEPDIPDLVIIQKGQKDTEKLRKECEDRNQDYIQVDSNLFLNTTQGGHFNSAYVLMRELLYQHTSYNESISLQCLPIYYLEPNSRITVNNIDSDIHGDFMIQSISIPLDINGTMSISATKALEQL